MDKQNTMNSAVNKRQYVAPQIEVIEVEVEKGFAASPGFEGTTPDSDDSEFGTASTRGTWGNLWE